MLYSKPQPKIVTALAGQLSVGTAFRRIDKKYSQDIYMVVAACGGVKLEGKDARESLIVNLVTGAIFTIFYDEEVIPCVHATVVENPND